MLPTSDAAAEPVPVHVVEDDPALRESYLRGYALQEIRAIGYSTGEAFLAQWRPTMRGVVAMDINLSTQGGMDGGQVFDRLIALRSHQPIIFITGPWGHNVRKCADFVTRRAYVNYFGKDEKPEVVDECIRRFLAEEPYLYEKAVDERWLLQQLTIRMTHAQRLAIEGSLIGSSQDKWAHEIGTNAKMLEFLVKAAYDQIDGVRQINGRRRPTVFAMMIAPLMDRMNVRGDRHGKYRLSELVAKELCHRLRLLDESQQRALQAALRSPSPATLSATAKEALCLMDIEGIAKFRSLIKMGGQELLGHMEPELLDPCHRWVHHWLIWVATRPPVTEFHELPDLDADTGD